MSNSTAPSVPTDRYREKGTVEAFHETTDEAAFELTQPMKSAGREAPKAPVALEMRRIRVVPRAMPRPYAGMGLFYFLSPASIGRSAYRCVSA